MSMTRRTARVLTLGVFMALAAMQTGLGSAATVSTYDTADASYKGTGTAVNPDGTQTADATAAVTGRLTADVDVTAASPAGGAIYGYGVGGAQAYAYPAVRHTFASVPAGSHSLSGVFSLASVSLTATPSTLNVYGVGSNATSGGVAYFTWYFYGSDGSYLYGGKYQILENGVTTGFTLSDTVTTTVPGYFLTAASVGAAASAVGTGSASATIDATVTSMSVT